jgi:hypothetical protein
MPTQSMGLAFIGKLGKASASGVLKYRLMLFEELMIQVLEHAKDIGNTISGGSELRLQA